LLTGKCLLCLRSQRLKCETFAEKFEELAQQIFVSPQVSFSNHIFNQVFRLFLAQVRKPVRQASKEALPLLMQLYSDALGFP